MLHKGKGAGWEGHSAHKCRHPAAVVGVSLFGRQQHMRQPALPTAACCCMGAPSHQCNRNYFDCDELGLSLSSGGNRRWSKSSRINWPLSNLKCDIFHHSLVRALAAEEEFCTSGF